MRRRRRNIRGAYGRESRAKCVDVCMCGCVINDKHVLDFVRLKDVDLLVCANVKKPARTIIGTRAKGKPRGEELNRVDVCLMPEKRLLALPVAHIPQLGR